MTGRSALAENLHLDPTSPTKTFVLDVHVDESSPGDLLRDVTQGDRMQETDDAYLYKVEMESGSFWVDQLDERFWSFHTDMPAAAAHKWLHEKVEQRRDFDWIWLPSQHLRAAWPGAAPTQIRTEFSGARFLEPADNASTLKLQASGRNADQLLDYLSGNRDYRSAVSLDAIQLTLVDEDFGHVQEGINRKGRFAASGDSLELHLQFVQRVVARYSNFVRSCEDLALAFHAFDEEMGGGDLSGSAILISFTRRVPDMSRFLDALFSARRPFRLWGVHSMVQGVAEVEAVDLHVGQRLRFDVGDSWMRLYLEPGACGNTVARLISNLQHSFDSALTIADPALNAALG